MELTRRNQVLETQLLPKTKPRDDQEGSDESSYRRLDVKVVNVAAAESSSSGARIVDLLVAVRGGGCDILDLVITIMEFLKKDERVGFISVEADTKVEESISVNRVVSRLKIEVCLFTQKSYAFFFKVGFMLIWIELYRKDKLIFTLKVERVQKWSAQISIQNIFF